MELLYIVIGMLGGVILTYVKWYVPMSEEIENLQEGIHDCIKSGMLGPEPDNEGMEGQQ